MARFAAPSAKTILEGGKGTQRQLGIADIGPIQLVEEIAKLMW